MRILHAIIWYGIVPEAFVVAGSAIAMLSMLSAVLEAQPVLFPNPEMFESSGPAVWGMIVGAVSSVWMGRRLRAIPGLPILSLLAPGVGLTLAMGFMSHPIWSAYL